MFPINLAAIEEPLIKIDQNKTYGIIKGPNSTNYYAVQPNGVANNISANYSFPVPSIDTFVDRKIYIVAPIQITFTGETPDINQGLLQSDRDAFRSLPINNSINTITVNLNGTAVTLNSNEMIHALQWYINSHEYEFEFSNSPIMPDMSQTYESLQDSLLNPLRSYKNYVYGSVPPRGAIPMEILENTGGVGATATIRAILAEPLMISPLHFNKNLVGGFIGLNQNLIVNINWVPNLAQNMWSHMGSLDIGGSDITSATATFYQNPYLLIRTAQPTELGMMQIPEHIVFNYDEFRSLISTNASTILPGATSPVNSGTLQLSTIPRRLFIFCRKSLSEESITRTDSFFAIENINITLFGRAGLLAEATKRDLYNISKKNGVNMTWSQWSGENIDLWSGNTGETINGVGSVLVVNIPEDLTLPNADSYAPSMDIQTNLIVTGIVKNVHPTDSLTPNLYVVLDYQGIFEISNGRANLLTAILSVDDIRSTPLSTTVSYSDVQMPMGGNIFSGITGLLSGLPGLLVKGLNFASKIAPVVQAVSGAMQPSGSGIIGGRKPRKKRSDAGKPRSRGGAYVGGRKISRSQLARY